MSFSYTPCQPLCSPGTVSEESLLTWEAASQPTAKGYLSRTWRTGDPVLKDDQLRLCDKAMAKCVSSLHLHAALTSTLAKLKEQSTGYPGDLHNGIISNLIPSWARHLWHGHISTCLKTACKEQSWYIPHFVKEHATRSIYQKMEILLTFLTVYSATHSELLAFSSLTISGNNVLNIDLTLTSMKHKQEFTSPTVSLGEFWNKSSRK